MLYSPPYKTYTDAVKIPTPLISEWKEKVFLNKKTYQTTHNSVFYPD